LNSSFLFLHFFKYQACATIEKLKQDSSTLMEAYSDLKFENEELMNKMKELDPGVY